MKKLSLTEIENISPAALRGLEGKYIVSSKYVIGLFTAKLRRQNIQYKIDFNQLSVEIVK